MLYLRSFNRFILIGITFTLLLFAGGANAVVVDGKDWRQVVDTTGYSWNDFDAIFDTTTGACDVVGCLLGGTVDLTGFTWASNADVSSMFDTYHAFTGIDNNYVADHYVGLAPTSLDAMQSDFTPTNTIPASQRQTKGWTRHQLNTNSATVYGAHDSFGGSIDVVYREIHFGDAQIISEIGGWAYKPVSNVPVPAAIWLFGTALIGLVGFGKRRKTV